MKLWSNMPTTRSDRESMPTTETERAAPTPPHPLHDPPLTLPSESQVLQIPDVLQELFPRLASLRRGPSTSRFGGRGRQREGGGEGEGSEAG